LYPVVCGTYAKFCVYPSVRTTLHDRIRQNFAAGVPHTEHTDEFIEHIKLAKLLQTDQEMSEGTNFHYNGAEILKVRTATGAGVAQAVQ